MPFSVVSRDVVGPVDDEFLDPAGKPLDLAVKTAPHLFRRTGFLRGVAKSVWTKLPTLVFRVKKSQVRTISCRGMRITGRESP
jgi:hypothetical protein